MRRSNLITLLYLVLVFVSGAVVGGFADRLLSIKNPPVVSANPPRNHAEFRKRYVQEMRTRLHLTESQVSDLQQILDVTDKQLRDARKVVDDQHAQKVIAMLNENQKGEYAKMREEREKRRQQQQQEQNKRGQ
ncbi:MAG: hypothetical protein U0Q18_08615 [Bryobacteraceae bacterium]